MKKRLAALAALATIATGAIATPAFAKDGDVIVTGACSVASSYKLKVQPRPSNNRSEVEFEVDQNRVNQRWDVTITNKGATVFSGVARTTAPSGSFTVRRVIRGDAAPSIVATATNIRTGETCSASAAA